MIITTNESHKFKKESCAGNDQYAIIPAFAAAGVAHAFTTRLNGLGARNSGSKAPGDWNAVADMCGIGHDKLVTVNQVHEDAILSVDENNYPDVKKQSADALITASPGIAIGVETADCVPILLFDPSTPAIAAVHAGWRSTVKKIVLKSVQKMQAEYGSDPSRMIAAIGPAIGPECYEVDEVVMGPVRAAFLFWEEAAHARGNDRWSLDLARLNARELMRIGLQERNVHSLGLCTSCNRDRFYSFRAEGRTGRMLSVIMIRP